MELTNSAVRHLTRVLPAVGEVNGTWLRQRLEQLLRHPERGVWKAAARALGKVGDAAIDPGFLAR